MNLYVILLLLAVQGLGNPTSGGEPFNGDDPWSGEDVSGGSVKEQLDLNSATGTGEDNNPVFSGNDSGFHSGQEEPADENLRTYPRTSRKYTTSKTITSGLGEDDGGSHSKSQWDSDDEGSNGRAEPKMDLAKIGDAIDVMKKLKKVKSDEEFARKLKSGPESLGVAFKTFEQLSGLWISVMHRIWRVWKAKGAKEVMHSIVHSMFNNTRRAIAQKVGNLLSNKTVLDSTDNGSSAMPGTALAEFNEGSSEPEISTHLGEVQNQQASSTKIPVHIITSKQSKSGKSFKSPNTSTVESFSIKDFPVEKIEVSFVKNSSKSTNKYSRETQARNSSSRTTTKPTKEKLKISFSSKKSELGKSPSAQKANNSALNKEGQKEISRTVSLSDAKKDNMKTGLRANLTSEPSFKNVSHKDKEIGNASNNSQGDTEPGQQSKNTIEPDETGTQKTSVKNVTEGSVTNNIKIQDESAGTHTVERSVALGQNSSNAFLGQERASSAKQLRGSEKTVSVVVYRPENTNGSFADNDVSQVAKPTVVQEKNEQKGTDEKIRKVENDLKTVSGNEVKKSEYNKRTAQKAMRLEGSAQEHGSSSIGVSSEGEVALNSLQNAGTHETTGEQLKDKDISNFRKKESKSDGTVQHDTKGDQTSNAPIAKKTEKNGMSLQRNTTLSTQKTSTQVRLRENLEPSTDEETLGLRKAAKDFQVRESNRREDKADETNVPDKILQTSPSDRQRLVGNASGNPVPSQGNDSQQNLTPQNESSNTPQSSENGTKSQGSPENNRHLLVTQKPIVTHDAPTPSAAQSSVSLQIAPNGQRKQKEPQSANNETKIESNFANIGRVSPKSHQAEIDSSSKDKTAKVNGGQLQEEKQKKMSDKVDDTGDVYMDVQEKRKQNGQKEDLEQRSKTVEQSSVQQTESNAVTLPKKKPAKTVEYLEASKSVNFAREGSQEKSNHFSEQEKDVNKNAVVTHRLKTSLIRGSRDPEKSLQNDSKAHRDVYPESTQKKRDETRKAAGDEDKEKTAVVGNATKMGIKSHSTIEESNKLRKSHSGSRLTNQTATPARKDSAKDYTKTHNRSATKTVDSAVVSSGTHNTSISVSTTTMQTPVQDTESGSEKSQIKSERVIKTNKKHSYDPSSTLSGGESVNASNRLSLVSHNSPNQTNLSVETLKNITNTKIEDRKGATKESEAPSSVNESSVNTSNNVMSKESSGKQNTQHQGRERTRKKETKSQARDAGRSKNEEHKHMPIHTQSNSSRSNMKPNSVRREEIKPSLTNKVDVLTSRTPPTSLLTTSSDDNTYSIKQLIQGPNGTSYLYPVEPSARQLERKVAKLESEVTVLEAAMADMAKRLLALEQRPGNMQSTMPPPVTPESEDTLHESSVYNNQQTTVYLGKHVEQLSPISTSGPEPERIVIPISSLTPGGEMHVPAFIDKDTSSVLTDSALGHDLQTNARSLEQKEKLVRAQNNGHASSSHTAPKSEAHAIVRPIVNIIMPNNREGLMPEGAPCFPRCRNGGSCLEGNTCKCPTFFIGSHCERFSLRDLLNSPKTWGSPYRKPQRYVVLEQPDRQEMERAFNLDSDAQTFRLKDFNPIFEPEKEIVGKQEPVEVVTPSNGKADADDGMRRKQFILEI